MSTGSNRKQTPSVRSAALPGEARLTTRSLALLISCALLPFVQLGVTYYLSVGTIIIVLLVAGFYRIQLLALARIPFYLFPVPLMFLALFWVGGSVANEDLLRVVREAVFFVLTISALSGALLLRRIHVSANMLLLLRFVLGAMLLFVIVQIYGIARIQYFGLPEKYYISNAATLPGELDLIYSKIRPAGTFGEPSYLGFFALSALVAVSPMITTSRPARIVAGLATAIGLLSQSVSFLLAFVVISFILLIHLPGRWQVRVGRLVVVGVVIAIAAVAAEGLRSRVLNTGISGTDISTQGRIWTPIFLMPRYLVEFPLGQPISDVPSLLSSISARAGYGYFAPMDNALANMVFQYGLVGFAVVAVLLTVTRNLIMRAYVLLSMFFNGNFLSIDKCAMFILVAMTFQSFMLEAARRRAPPVPAPGPAAIRRPTWRVVRS